MKLFAILFVSAWLVPAVFAADFARWVDPRIGCSENGHCQPAATTPFGLVSAGPDTGVEWWHYCGGYQWRDRRILGFSQDHVSGTGCGDLGDLMLMPFRGDWKGRTDFSSAFSHANESAEPGYYRVRLDDAAAEVEIAAAPHSAIYRVTCADRPQLLVDLQHGFTNWKRPMEERVLACAVERKGTRGLCGTVKTRMWVDRTYHFSVEFDRDIETFERLPPRDAREKGDRYAVGFAGGAGTLGVKLALSATSREGAAKNLAAEIPDWDFARVRTAARAQWNRYLSRIEIDADDREKTAFYTSLYHLFIHPNNLSDVGEKPFYSTFSTWDTFRAANPLFTLLVPELVPAFVDSLVTQHDRQGFMPIWTLWGEDNQCMIGNHSIPMVVDAYLKGFPHPDWKGVYARIRRSLTEDRPGRHFNGTEAWAKYGYFPCDLFRGETASRTLEHAYDDWCAARMAERLGFADDAAMFDRRAHNWTNIFDRASGFMRGRLADGTWREPFDPRVATVGAGKGKDFTEGSSWHYSWHVMQHPEELIALHGGREKFVRDLEGLFTAPEEVPGGKPLDVTGLIGQYCHGNEPSHHTAYFFTLAGRPDLTAKYVNRICDSFYRPEPEGLCGNDDCGQMSAWYVFSCLGFYPFNPCGGTYVTVKPRFRRAEIRVPGRAPYVIDAEHIPGGGGPVVTHAEIVRGTAAALPNWSGQSLTDWKVNRDIVGLTCADGLLKGRICGRDSQLSVVLRPSFAARNNRYFVLRLRTNCGGVGQVFWMRRQDASFSESRQRKIRFNGDGAWHDYRVRTGWTGGVDVKALRLDFPTEYADDSFFELASVAIEEIGEETPEIDADKTVGVCFSLQAPKGLHYGRLTWASDETGAGEFGFTTATDGERHDYWLDLRRAKRLAGPDRGKPAWRGRIANFEGSRLFGEEMLDLQNLRFVTAPPDTPADPVITSVDSSEAIPRAGRPFVVEAIVRNFGTRPATNLCFSFDGLPSGVKALEPERLAPSEPLPGSDGSETIDDDWRSPLAHERVFRFRLSDLGAGTHRLGLTLAADGIAPRRVAFTVEVKPSLGLAKADYPPPPIPVKTGRYQIGALLFPGWDTHQWHAVWSHEPKRKPLLGWYDEANPETIDWQIKHLVENGVSFVSVDWYWRNGNRTHTHWQKAFRAARYRRFLKWHLMWDNGFNSAEDQEALARCWCDECFSDPQYQTVDGCPVVTICSPQGMEARMRGQGGAKRLLEITRRVARERGYKGVYFVAMRGFGSDSTDAAFLRKFADWGFDLTTVYGFRGSVPGTVEGTRQRRAFSWLADVSLGHWRELAKNGTLPFWPSLSTGYDDRPWRGERVLEIYGYNARDFRRICRDAKAFADESGVTTFLMGPLDEWGEGSIGYPNREHGFAILEAVRDTFGEKPADGWPVNFAPEDVGLACPEKHIQQARRSQR